MRHINFAHILVPLDGSPLAEGALPLAVELARLYQSRLDLLRLQAPPAGTTELLVVPPPVESPYLEGVARTLVEHGVDRVQTVTDFGFPEVDIVAHAQRLDSDLVVMASHSRRGLSRWAQGSVAERVVRGANCPTLVVPRDHKSTGLRRILVALDGSDLAEAALDYAVDLAGRLKVALNLVRVVPPGASSAEAQLYLERLVRGLSVEASWSCATGDPEMVLPELASLYDLVLMSSHGRGGWQRLMLGSVAARVVRHSLTPTLVVNALTAERQPEPAMITLGQRR